MKHCSACAGGATLLRATRMTGATFIQARCAHLVRGTNRSLGQHQGTNIPHYRLPLRRALRLIDSTGRHNASMVETEDCVSEEQLQHHSHDGEGVSQRQEDAARYAAYHCHHMLTSFRVERQRWGENTGTLSVEDLSRIVEYIFYASVLLHLTALYQTADKYCEDLIGAVISCSIFVSKNVEEILKSLSTASASGTLMAANKRLAYQGSDMWNSLHWAAVHYSQGVCYWGLLDHTEPLFDMRRLHAPFRGLFSTYVKLVCKILAHAGMPREDKQLLSYVKSPEGCNRWFGEEVNGGLAVSTLCFPGSAAGTACSGVHDNHCFPQQRRLQLLPLIWVALLSCHCAVSNEENRFRSARHAFLHALPLFSKEAKAENVVMLLARLLYIRPSTVLKANSVDVGMLLARAEQCNVFPPSSSVPSVTYAAFLRLWMCADVAQEKEPEVRGVHKAYAAFRAIPLCALQLDGEPHSPASGGDAFVRHLLLRALLQWSFRLTAFVSFRGEVEEILKSTQHVVQLLDHARRRPGWGGRKETIVVDLCEAVLRAFAVRVSVICGMDAPLKKEDYALIAEFDDVVRMMIRSGEDRSSLCTLPTVYECMRPRRGSRSYAREVEEDSFPSSLTPRNSPV
ncbi:hypothetical protein, conserved [Trypanosoma brucei gambiense DAL972]|uniref:Uncharacterized protein n=2 Tax=Trypanosoma brucei TaxID=5691 RepID=D0AAD2_TRYB9|nr:hypothetical protein, conserved [Trypanosoma brucei gambiense DAL972]RHW67672.1 hypothetical protein DPX39_110132300 [Trypanosoma brucei equiperdum]CBH18633.1 hypothetical protein, conserved [Trypanosoma brucei gambiense DAL972]|eukprot:XP_011780897.1 hypothetical protein, conserved [Trypanosoma brucei gambiense DAL972]